MTRHERNQYQCSYPRCVAPLTWLHHVWNTTPWGTRKRRTYATADLGNTRPLGGVVTLQMNSGQNFRRMGVPCTFLTLPLAIVWPHAYTTDIF